MNRFAIARARTYDQAAALLEDGRFSLPVLKAGGMDVVDHLKEGLLEPDVLIDVQPAGGEPVGRTAAGLVIDANATLAQLGASSDVNELAPVIAQACASAATPQVRNVASAAGNLLQRPRCWYYRNQEFDCLKKGGFRCFAVEGENRYHAIFGDGPCHIVHPSNLAVALVICDGVLTLTGGDRDSLAIGDLYHMPDRGIRDEHNLEAGEVVTGIRVSARPNSAFYAVKEKQSFDWPLVCVAASVDLDGDRIASARVCAGAVAPTPWPLPKVEQALAGVSLGNDDALRAACSGAADGATPLTDNAYKTRLLPVAVRRAVLRAAGREVEALT